MEALLLASVLAGLAEIVVIGVVAFFGLRLWKRAGKTPLGYATRIALIAAPIVVAQWFIAMRGTRALVANMVDATADAAIVAVLIHPVVWSTLVLATSVRHRQIVLRRAIVPTLIVAASVMIGIPVARLEVNTALARRRADPHAIAWLVARCRTGGFLCQPVGGFLTDWDPTEVLISIAGDARAPATVIDALSRRNESRIRDNALRNPRLPASRFRDATVPSDQFDQAAMLANPSAPHDVIDSLLTRHPELQSWATRNAAFMCRATPSTLHILAASDYDAVRNAARVAVANTRANPSCQPKSE